MGTNYYYYEKEACECCGRDFEGTHIGKSSAGWCFALHVYPELGINDLDDWERVFKISGSIIKNEYGDLIDIEQMIEIICNRRNRSRRHEIDNLNCVKHGSGTWDCIISDFR